MMDPHATQRRIEEKTFVYASPDQRRLRLSLFAPLDGDALLPAIVLIHGGAWVIGTRHQLRWYGRTFAQHGFVAVSIQYRLMPTYTFPHCLHDCHAAVRWLRLNAEDIRVDPERICVMGNSAGGHLALLVGSTSGVRWLEGDENVGPSTQVRAVVSLYGPTDLNDYIDPSAMITLGGITKGFIDRFAGKEKGNFDTPVEVASPISHVSTTTPPTLLIHGTSDPVVPFRHSQKYHDRLEALGVPSELVSFRGQSHAFDIFHPSLRPQVFHHIQSFLERFA